MVQKPKKKFVLNLRDIASAFALAGFIGLALLFPIAAIGSITWVVVTGTTPDILPLWKAVTIGAFIGVVLTALVVGIALKSTGDAFPDLITGFALPCALIFITSCIIVHPFAAKLTELRLKKTQSTSSSNSDSQFSTRNASQ